MSDSNSNSASNDSYRDSNANDSNHNDSSTANNVDNGPNGSGTHNDNVKANPGSGSNSAGKAKKSKKSGPRSATAGSRTGDENKHSQQRDDSRKHGKGESSSSQNETTMIGHGEFFDADGDGVFWPSDIFYGFLALGFSFPFAIFAAFGISTLSYYTLPANQWLPDPFFRIYVDGLHKGKHGSDTGSFKRDGEFDEKTFDKFWDSHTDAPHEEITPVQLYDAVAERRVAYDLYGTCAAFLEWFATWLLLGYPSFHFDIRLAYGKVKELILARSDAKGKGKAQSTDETGTGKDNAITKETLSETVLETIKKTQGALTVVSQAACSGGNVRKEDVKGIYDGTIFYTIMDRQVEAGNLWAKDWKTKHECARAMKKLELTA